MGPAVTGAMMFCTECGKQIPRESKFCHACWAKLVWAVAFILNS